MISLLTNQQYNELNKQEENKPQVDSVFKGNLKGEIEPAPTFKANKLKYKQIIISSFLLYLIYFSSFVKINMI